MWSRVRVSNINISLVTAFLECNRNYKFAVYRYILREEKKKRIVSSGNKLSKSVKKCANYLILFIFNIIKLTLSYLKTLSYS